MMGLVLKRISGKYNFKETIEMQLKEITDNVSSRVKVLLVGIFVSYAAFSAKNEYRTDSKKEIMYRL
jgi:hypothetical protein